MKTRTIIEYERGDEVEIISSNCEDNLGITGIVIKGCRFEEGDKDKTSYVTVCWDKPVQCVDGTFEYLTNTYVSKIKLKKGRSL